MTRAAGWYDDPQDVNNLRYWDGVQWTDHMSPKRKPDLDRAGQQWGPAAGGGPDAGAPPQGGLGKAQGQGQWGGPQSGNPYAGQTGQQPYQRPSTIDPDAGPTAPDGRPVVGFGRRLGARVIDWLLVGIVSGVLATVLVPDLQANFSDYVSSAGTSVGAQIPADLAADLTRAGLIIGGVGLVYEAVLLRTRQATLGKLVLGLQVVPAEGEGPLTWGQSALRAFVWHGPSFSTGIQLLNTLLSLFGLLNGLWPLWDSGKQSLNDKIAKTYVVRAPR